MATKSDDFLEILERPSNPPSFLRNYVVSFYDRYGCIYARRYDGQILMAENSSDLVAGPIPKLFTKFDSRLLEGLIDSEIWNSIWHVLGNDIKGSGNTYKT